VNNRSSGWFAEQLSGERITSLRLEGSAQHEAASLSVASGFGVQPRGDDSYARPGRIFAARNCPPTVICST
jgi:hypothetical protein